MRRARRTKVATVASPMIRREWHNHISHRALRLMHNESYDNALFLFSHLRVDKNPHFPRRTGPYQGEEERWSDKVQTPSIEYVRSSQ